MNTKGNNRGRKPGEAKLTPDEILLSEALQDLMVVRQEPEKSKDYQKIRSQKCQS